MQLEPLRWGMVHAHWSALLVPHSLFVGEAFEVLVDFLAANRWYPVEANALTHSRPSLQHGPGWISYEQAPMYERGLRAIMGLSRSGYTLLHANMDPHRPHRVHGVLATPEGLGKATGMTEREAITDGWLSSAYRHQITGSAHGKLHGLRLAQDAMAQGIHVVATIGT